MTKLFDLFINNTMEITVLQSQPTTADYKKTIYPENKTIQRYKQHINIFHKQKTPVNPHDPEQYKQLQIINE